MEKIQKPINLIKVLHLIEHLEVGGAEKAVVNIVQSLDKDRFYSVVCLYRKMGSFADELQKTHHRVVFLRKTIFTSHSPRLFKLPFLLLESVVFIFRLARLMRKNEIDIVHSHMFSANLWGRLAALIGGRPGILTTEHTTSDWQVSTKETVFNRLLAPLSNRVVAVSKTVADTVAKEQRIDSNKLVTIVNAVKLDNKYSHMQKKISLPGTMPRIGIIAYLVPVKRHDLLFHALEICIKRIPQMSCCVIGDGPERNRLEQMVKDMNLTQKVFFLGERYDVSSLLQELNLVVSTSDNEGLPMNLLEAMAAGIPVVATDVGGTSDLIETGKTGVLVKAGDVQEIANGICSVLNNPELANKMGKQGMKKIKETYSLEKIIKIWETLYKDIFNEQNR
jgi:glycosyltransferase involved in cell wall biosynthesis